MDLTLRYEVVESSQVGEARRAAAAAARSVGFDAADTERVALCVTELGTNLVKHADRGEIVVVTLRAPRVDVLSIDRGPGTDNAGKWLRDGFSTSGSPGTGLGAVSRLSDAMDLYSVPGRGTVTLARILPRRRPDGGRDDLADAAAAGLEIGGLAVPIRGEDACGDAWTSRARDGLFSVVLSDGLGHGPDAARTSAEALAAFRQHADMAPAGLLEAMGDRLRTLRGAAVAVATLDCGAASIRYAGVGNIGAAIVSDAGQQNLVSHNGIVGQPLPRAPREFSYPWPRGAVLVMHSDGLKSRWRLDDYPGLSRRDPAVIAAVLYRDYGRGSDDAGIVVVREARNAVPGGGSRPGA